MCRVFFRKRFEVGGYPGAAHFREQEERQILALLSKTDQAFLQKYTDSFTQFFFLTTAII